MDRLALVELIEDQAARLTPEGRGLAERMELVAEAPPAGQAATYKTQRSQADEAGELSPRDRSIIERLLMLWEGLELSEVAEHRGEWGARFRDMAVIDAAGMKDRNEGRKVEPDMTPEQALARLREPG